MDIKERIESVLKAEANAINSIEVTEEFVSSVSDARLHWQNNHYRNREKPVTSQINSRQRCVQPPRKHNFYILQKRLMET